MEPTPGQQTTYEVPAPETLTMQELDDVLEITGIDVMDPVQVRRPAKVLAALVTWQRRRNGETVDFDAVYRTLTASQVRIQGRDAAGNPTSPPAVLNAER